MADIRICPVCHQANEEWRVICKTRFCVHVFRSDNPQTGVAVIGRTYPVGTIPCEKK